MREAGVRGPGLRQGSWGPPRSREGSSCVPSGCLDLARTGEPLPDGTPGARPWLGQSFLRLHRGKRKDIFFFLSWTDANIFSFKDF